MREKCLHSQCMCVCVSLDVWCSIVLYTGSNISILAPKRLSPELYNYFRTFAKKFGLYLKILVQAVRIE